MCLPPRGKRTKRTTRGPADRPALIRINSDAHEILRQSTVKPHIDSLERAPNMMHATILFLSANPSGTVSLDLDEEYRAIDDERARAVLRDQLDLRPKSAARVEDFRRGMAEHDPVVVHFSGHGARTVGKVPARGPGGFSGVRDMTDAESFAAEDTALLGELLVSGPGGRATRVPILTRSRSSFASSAGGCGWCCSTRAIASHSRRPRPSSSTARSVRRGLSRTMPQLPSRPASMQRSATAVPSAPRSRQGRTRSVRNGRGDPSSSRSAAARGSMRTESTSPSSGVCHSACRSPATGKAGRPRGRPRTIARDPPQPCRPARACGDHWHGRWEGRRRLRRSIVTGTELPIGMASTGWMQRSRLAASARQARRGAGSPGRRGRRGRAADPAVAAFKAYLQARPDALVALTTSKIPPTSIPTRRPASCRRAWGATCSSRRVGATAPSDRTSWRFGALSEDSSVRLLLSTDRRRKSTLQHGRPDELDAARRICRLLGGLPLALALAAAYLGLYGDEDGVSLASYLARLGPGTARWGP